MSYKGPINTMNSEKVLKMVENYRNNSNFCDTKSIRFELDDLKKFIHDIEQNAVERGLNKNTLGLRFYYSAYSSNPGDISYPTNPQFAGKHTLVMLPTTKVSENEHVDFDASDSLTPLGENYVDVLELDEVPNSALNHGSLFPPCA